MEPIRLALPWPPSVNHYLRYARGRVYLPAAGLRYRARVAEAVRAADGVGRLRGRLSVGIVAHPPDRRRRDIDNVAKCALDAMQHAGMIEDDEVIDALAIRRGRIVEAGLLRVTVRAVDDGICPMCGT